MILTFIKKLIPTPLFRALQPSYHYAMAFLASLVYGFPSNKLIVVGVTGTTGKTTVTYLAAQMLRGAGLKVGYTSTALFSDGTADQLNDKKMTMLGRFFTQRMLAQMVKNKCDVAIVETTSEGIVQFRHRFINYDVALFTGLYPEHIDSHGSFENYKNEKLKLFSHLAHCKKKSHVSVPKTIIAHGDDEHAKDFLNYPVQKKIVFSKENGVYEDVQMLPYAYHETNKTGVQFSFAETDVQLQLLGDFTATNATAAAAIGTALGVASEKIKTGLEKITGVPGRVEKIDEGQDFTVIVDYAFEPVALTKLYETIAPLNPSTVIHVLGSTGGGRDVSRRAQAGKIAGEHADIVIVTNEDPYDDDPRTIMDDVSAGAVAAGKKKDKNLFIVEERGAAIQSAIDRAQKDAVVLITGKGSEQAIVGKDLSFTPWDDRDAARRALCKRKD